MIHDDVPATIRDAVLVRLGRLPGDAPGRVVVALASAGTATADADALAMRCLASLERGGGLAGATTLVACGATFGASIAMLAAARGLACVIVIDDTATREQRNRVRAFGAELRSAPARGEAADGGAMASTARSVAAQTPGGVLVEKRRVDAGPAEEVFGERLARATGDALFAVVGADRDALPLAGIRRALVASARDAAVVSLAFDGASWSGDVNGAPLLVSESDALATARRMAREEGVLAAAAEGGAAVAAALRLASDAPSGGIVVALVPAADRHDLITAYDDAWWAENHGDAQRTSLTAAGVLAHKDEGPGALVTLEPDATVAQAIRIMRDLEVSQIPVLRGDRIVGTIREDQVIDLLLHAPERKEGAVETVMEDPLPEIDEAASVTDLQSLLVRGGSAVIVRRRDGAREILTKYDLIHALARG